MESAASNKSTIFLSCDASEINKFLPFRSFENIKICKEKDVYWLKSENPDVIVHPMLQKIFSLIKYEERMGYLFEWGKNIPSCLPPIGEWTDLRSFFPAPTFTYRENFHAGFAPIEISLVRSDKYQTTTAILTSEEQLRQYLYECSTHRLKNLRWTIVDSNPFILGTPILPIQGNGYWSISNHLLPIGWMFQWGVLLEMMEKLLISNPNDLILWDSKGTYVLLSQDQFTPLSRSSFRNTYPRKI